MVLPRDRHQSAVPRDVPGQHRSSLVIRGQATRYGSDSCYPRWWGLLLVARSAPLDSCQPHHHLGTDASHYTRIHGARSRPIIHLERSASASPLEFAPDPAPLRAALQATSVVSDRACAAQNHAPGMRLHPSQLHLHSTISSSACSRAYHAPDTPGAPGFLLS